MPIDKTRNVIWVRKTKRRMDKRSYRVKKLKSGELLRFACPKGKWKRGRCKVGMKLQAIGHRR